MDKFANFREFFFFLELKDGAREHEIASCDRDANSLKSNDDPQKIKMLIVTSCVAVRAGEAECEEAFRPQRVD
jgi:hypothetical protein